MYTFLLTDLVMRNHCVACILSLVGMALTKAIGYMVVILVMYYSLDIQGRSQSQDVYFEVRVRSNTMQGSIPCDTATSVICLHNLNIWNILL